MSSNNVKRINNLHVWLGGAHMRGVRVGALQSCQSGFKRAGRWAPGSQPCRAPTLTPLMCATPSYTCKSDQLVTIRHVGVLLKGEVLSSSNAKCINNLHVWPRGAHMRGAITMEMAVQEAFDNTGRVITAVEVYRPEALVLHSRVYSLTGDALAKFNLFIKGHTACIVLFSCWLVVGEELDDKLPFNQYNGEFKHNKIVS
ncbi:hypothetical protein HID58_055316 [Brassica napus]|uniref:Uncharacterized protein n=1 Tax=Brassica napus TaxID=3708 RepID=A0ABQ8AK52_BRANA|nr:hypothetical protein HID58_055316 [Brassica napus]